MFRETPLRAPRPPRELTRDMRADTAAIGRMFRIFGAVWTSLGVGAMLVTAAAALLVSPPAIVGTLWGALAALAGASLLAVAEAKRRRALRVFREGTEAQGEVVSVGRDYRVRVNGKNPWRVRYRFEAGGRSHEGAYSCWTDEPPATTEGAPVIVLHDPDDPSSNVLWTRVHPLALEPTVEAARVRVAAPVRVESAPAQEEEHGDASPEEKRRA